MEISKLYKYALQFWVITHNQSLSNSQSAFIYQVSSNHRPLLHSSFTNMPTRTPLSPVLPLILDFTQRILLFSLSAFHLCLLFSPPPVTAYTVYTITSTRDVSLDLPKRPIFQNPPYHVFFLLSRTINIDEGTLNDWREYWALVELVELQRMYQLHNRLRLTIYMAEVTSNIYLFFFFLSLLTLPTCVIWCIKKKKSQSKSYHRT